MSHVVFDLNGTLTDVRALAAPWGDAAPDHLGPEALDALAGRFAAGEMGVSLVQAASEAGLTYKQGVSEIARSRNPHHYSVGWEGHRLELGPHVALGSGSGAGFIARIYLHVADGTGEVPRGLYVGHVGRHLPDTTT